MPVYSLVARNDSDGSIKFLVSQPANSLGEFFDYLNAHSFVIPDKYSESPYRIYYNVDDVDSDEE